MEFRKRYCVYAGLFVLMFINYLDRVNLSVAASTTLGIAPR
jgi:ACS family glucarate transporter-like MFS transporter